jgi:hypothetical protein
MDQAKFEIEKGISQYKEVYGETGDQEAALLHLRNLGYLRTQSIAIICRVHGMHPNDAKAIVHFSGAWEDYRKPQERFEESFFKTFEKVEAEDDSPEIFEEINSDDDEN